MATSLTIDNETFQYPEAGDSPGWGSEATDWAKKVTELLNNLQASDDITQSAFSIANNVSSFTNITGLAFSTATVRAATIEYSLYRTTSLNELAETGIIQVVYKNTAASWELIRNFVGDSGVDFEITNTGQLRYKSTNVAGASYSGTLKFRGKTLTQ
jgi:hypothetical protein